MSTTIKLITVGELLGKSFHIPSYQRGYKWTQKQVEDLLNDIEEFIKNKNSGDSFYCLQPLAVVKKSSKLPSSIEIGEKETENDVIKKVKNAFSENVVWDVIDGQQRLTTIYLILCYLGGINEKLYSISYETREKSFDYLQSYKNPNTEAKRTSDDNVDFYHINQIYTKIKKWFDDKEDFKETFKKTLLDQTQFIWYETADDAIEVFTRMNIGKIGLTNSELIKALIVSKLNDKTKAAQIIKDWDSIEKQLQNDEFWYFIHSSDYNKPTRIDYLFDTLCDYYIDDKRFKNKKYSKTKYTDKEYIEKIGTDQYRTFRHYDLRFKESPHNDPVEEIWKEVISLYEVLIEWYNNLEYYHYIGYILCHKNKKMSDLYKEWEDNNKVDFFEKFLKPKIQEILKDCCKQNVAKNKKITFKDILKQQYELDKCPSKTVAKPILLLHNIQTVINQNKQGENQDEFKHPVFFRFPFHLYKNQNWDVEHIDSNSTNDLKDNFSKLLWLLQYQDIFKNKDVKYNQMHKGIIDYLINYADDKGNIDEEAIKRNIKNFSFKVESEGNEVTFDDIASEIGEIDEKLDDEKKNQIGNFTLLDASTNRGYGNSIFPAKRKVIMAKDRCMEYQLKLENKDGNWEFKDEPILSKIDTFIPPVTRNVFMKYYTPTTENFSTWNEDDFDGYRNDMKTVLSKFLEETNNNK